jgi:L-fucose mutarotase/ribose pyranase (RbsD/FucU family)
MLKDIDPLLGPDLLRTLRAMGYGDEVTTPERHRGNQ